MRERTTDFYRVQDEELEGGSTRFNTPRGGYNQGGRGVFRGR
jgi:hypothetical protein